MTETVNKTTTGTDGRRWVALLRLAGLIAALVALNLGVSALLHRFAVPLTGGNFMLSLTLLMLLLAYVLLLALPFVPGIEIGISLLIAHGSAAAPFVYFATLAGLLLAYGAGVLLSGRVSCYFLGVLGMPRACAFVDRIKLLDRRQRLDMMRQAMPVWANRWLVDRRAIVLAVLLNLPGNSLIGGGGGIAMLAGLSRSFTIWQFSAIIALATLPVPLLVYLFGAGLLS